MDVEAVLSGADRSVGAGLLRAALTPLAWLHQGGLELYLLPYRTGVRKRCRLPVPTIAIGNLSSGGTGKTPMAVLVAQELLALGKSVAILSRGHGGSHERERGAQIVSRGDGRLLLSPEVAGDEPTLLARRLPDVPVIVGRDRRVSGRLAVALFAPDVILLDDALQFWQLERDLDIVLLDTRRPFDNGFVLPRGLLREPPSHLARAGVVVLTRYDAATPAQQEAARAAVARHAPKALALTGRHAPRAWVAPDGSEAPLEALAGRDVVAVSGIADGRRFEESLAALGVRVRTHSRFADHHAYNREDVDSLRHAHPDGCFVTTEKDRTKLSSLWPADAPLWALRIAMALDRPDTLRALLAERTTR